MRLLPLVTSGDRWSAGLGTATKGLFVKELEEALIDGRADIAVHSAKDLPGDLAPGLAIVAVPAREDPRDVFIGPPGGLEALPAKATVGTGSPRRSAQLRLLRPDVEAVPIRGNVDTRLRKLAEGQVDALVLAAAGLARLGLAPEGAVALAVEACVPAPGQGLLAIEGRAGRDELVEALAPLHDPLAGTCLATERALLAALGGGCMAPVGALCEPAGAGKICLVAFAASEDGGRAGRAEGEGPEGDPAGLAAAVAGRLRAIGAAA